MTPDDAKALRAPFPASAIGILPKPHKKDAPKGNCPKCGGYHGLPAVHLDYVGHAATTDRLLTIDPEWSWEPFALNDQGLPALDRDGNLWIKLTVCGVTRPGVGDGASMKERIGDAIRNAAMRFGVALDLWAKEDLHEVANPPEQVVTIAEVANHDTDTVSNAREAAHVWKMLKDHGRDSDQAAAARAAAGVPITAKVFRDPDVRKRVAQAIADASRDDGAHPSPSDELAALFPGDAS
jgi:hypothetical protein